MRFIVDAQLPPALARLLSAQGHQAEHVVDINLSTIWHYALKHQAVIVTDEDFQHRFSQSRTAPVIVWLRVGNTSRKALLLWFEPLLPQILDHLEQGDRFIEVR
jgi:predicted nuclease of predicted toxin-antitoxin system